MPITASTITTSKSSANNNGYFDTQPTPVSSSRTRTPTRAIRITADDAHTYQTLIGFGGSFTESGGYVFSHLTSTQKDEMIDAYFGAHGLHYSICRTHIQSCDFSLGNYCYVVDKDDTALNSFSIARDMVYLIPFIHHAQQRSTQDFLLIASPWSPPPFMKTNHSMTHGGKLNPEYADTWALMIAKFIGAYKTQGIDIWGITPQNEPEATQIWESCLYTAEEEAHFIYTHLVPMLSKHALSPHIIAWDHNRDQIVKRAKILYAHPAAAHVWGMATHWYEEVYLGKSLHNNIATFKKLYPDAHVIVSEACQELLGGKVKIGAWSTGERYARNIIGDLNAGCEAWIDWNMLLDSKGGPNHVGNLCDAPITYDMPSKTLRYSNSYYYIGHFSKFIPSGAARITHTLDMPTSAPSDKIYVTTWKHNSQVIMVILNTDTRSYPINIQYKHTTLSTTIPKHAIQTIIIENSDIISS